MSGVTSRTDMATACAAPSRTGLQSFIAIYFITTLQQRTPNRFGLHPQMASRSCTHDVERLHGGVAELKRSRICLELCLKDLSRGYRNAIGIYEPGFVREISRIESSEARTDTGNFHAHEHGCACIYKTPLLNRFNHFVDNSRCVIKQRQEPRETLLLQLICLLSFDVRLPLELKAHCPNRTSNRRNRTYGLHPRCDISGAVCRKSGVRICEGNRHQSQRHTPQNNMHEALSNSVHRPLPIRLKGSKS